MNPGDLVEIDYAGSPGLLNCKGKFQKFVKYKKAVIVFIHSDLGLKSEVIMNFTQTNTDAEVLLLIDGALFAAWIDDFIVI